MKQVMFFAVLCMGCGSAVAADGLRPGCYHRDYSAEHLRQHPEQVVDEITMGVERDEQGNLIARLKVATADQGHAGQNGLGNRIFMQSLICFDQNGQMVCAVECDGGLFSVTRQTEDAVTIKTKYLMVGDAEACGGTLDLAERPMIPVKYKLDLVPDAACKGHSQ